MNSVGEEFFASPGFARDQDRAIALRRPFSQVHNFLQRRAAPFDVVETVPGTPLSRLFVPLLLDAIEQGSQPGYVNVLEDHDPNGADDRVRLFVAQRNAGCDAVLITDIEQGVEKLRFTRPHHGRQVGRGIDFEHRLVSDGVKILSYEAR